MPARFSRRELVTGAAALVLGEEASAAKPIDCKKYPVELADPKVVTVTIGFDKLTRTISATPDNGSARLNMDDTLVIRSELPFVLQFIPLNGGPPHPFEKVQEDEKCPGRFKGVLFEGKVRDFETLPLPFYEYNIEVAGRVLDPFLIVDGRAKNPGICVGGTCRVP